VNQTDECCLVQQTLVSIWANVNEDDPPSPLARITSMITIFENGSTYLFYLGYFLSVCIFLKMSQEYLREFEYKPMNIL
jgi:hypothetical protein